MPVFLFHFDYYRVRKTLQQSRSGGPRVFVGNRSNIYTGDVDNDVDVLYILTTASLCQPAASRRPRLTCSVMKDDKNNDAYSYEMQSLHTRFYIFITWHIACFPRPDSRERCCMAPRDAPNQTSSRVGTNSSCRPANGSLLPSLELTGFAPGQRV